MGSEPEVSNALLKVLETLAGDVAVVRKIATYETEKIRADVCDLKRIVIEGNGEDSHKHKLRDHEKRIAAIEGEKVMEGQKHEKAREEFKGRGYNLLFTLATAAILSLAGVFVSILWTDHKAAQSVATSQTKADKSDQLKDEDIQRIVEAAVKKVADTQPVEPARTPQRRRGRRYDMPKPTLFPKGTNRLEAGFKKKDNLADLHVWADTPVPDEQIPMKAR